MTTGTYGNQTTENTAELYADLSGPNLRAFVPNAATQNLWVYEYHVQCGKATSTNASIRLALYAVDGNLNPTTFLNATGSANNYTAVTTLKTGTGDGVWLTIPATGIGQIFAGRHYALAAHAADANILIGMQDSASLGTVDDPQFYNLTRGGKTLPNPYGTPDTINIEGHLNIYALGQVNAAPYQPGTNGSTLSATNLTSTTPTFTCTFTDPDTTVAGQSADYISAYRIVAKDSRGNWLWDSGKKAATSAQQAAASVSIDYPTAGTPGARTLVNGGSYKYTFMVWDAFDVSSAWAADHTFTIASNGNLSNLTPTTGKIETTTPGPFTALWQHQTSLTATAVNVQLLGAGGGIVRGPTTVALSPAVAAGGTIAVTWAQTSWASLPTSTSYTVQLQAQDSAGHWTDWYTGGVLAVDSPPNLPVALVALNTTGQTVGGFTAPPLLSCQCTDSDDTVASGLVVYLELLDASDMLLSTHLMGLRAGTDRQFDYQVQAGDLVNSYATYHYRTYAFDGTFYSEGAGTTGITDPALAVRSATGSFVYEATPVITPTNPTAGGIVTTDIPIYTWTTNFTQTAFRVVVERDADGSLVSDTGVIKSSLHAWQQPKDKLRNGTTYDLTIYSTTSTGLQASVRVTFALQYTPPDTLALTADLVLRPGDVEPTGVHLSWLPSDDPNFLDYVLTRQDTVDVDGGTSTIILVNIGAINTTEWVDDTPPSGKPVTYGLVQQAARGADLLDLVSSVPSTQTVTLAFSQCVVANAIDPLLGRVVMEGRLTRTEKRVGNTTFKVPWNFRAPFEFTDLTDYGVLSNEYILLGSDADAQVAWETLSALKARPAPPATRDPVIYRDGRGNLIIGAISTLALIDDPGGVPRHVQLEVTETAAAQLQQKPILPLLPGLPPQPPLLKPQPNHLGSPQTEVVPFQVSFTKANTSALAHWKVLHLIVPFTSVGGVTNTMSVTEQTAAQHVITQFPDTISTLSGGKIQILNTGEVVTTRTLTKRTATPNGHGFWATPTDLGIILTDYKADRFDDVFVYVAVEGIDALPYQGLSYASLKGGYHYIPVTGVDGWVDTAQYTLVHEWLHEAMFVLAKKGFHTPTDGELNAGGVGSEQRSSQGTAYTAGPLDPTYLGDVLTGNVKENAGGTIVGGTDAAWKSLGGGGPVTGATIPVIPAVSGTTTPAPPSQTTTTQVGTPPSGSPWTIKTPSNPSNINGVDYRFLSFPVTLKWIPVEQTDQRPGIPMTPTSTTYHETGNTGSGNADTEAQWILNGVPGSDEPQTSVHFFVDDTHAVQLIPITERAWHAGDGGNGPGNSTSIAIEDCVEGNLNQSKVRSNCEELHALLLHHLGLDKHLTAGADYATVPGGQVALCCHRHWSGKQCPEQILDQGLWPSIVSAINSKMGT